MSESRSSKDGGIAFPISPPEPGEWFPGMSLRDYFAAQVVIRFLPGSLLGPGAKCDGVTRAMQLTGAAQAAYAVADAMLAEREPRP